MWMQGGYSIFILIAVTNAEDKHYPITPCVSLDQEINNNNISFSTKPSIFYNPAFASYYKTKLHCEGWLQRSQKTRQKTQE